MISKAKMIGAAMALSVVGAIGGTTVAFADEIDQAVAQVEESDANDATNWFVRFGFAPRAVAHAVAHRAVAHHAVAHRRWVAGRWAGFRYHRGYWR